MVLLLISIMHIPWEFYNCTWHLYFSGPSLLCGGFFVLGVGIRLLQFLLEYPLGTSEAQTVTGPYGYQPCCRWMGYPD